MKLKRLYIQRYKNLADLNVNLEKGDGLAIIVGNNGSGKSNFLEVISGIFHDLYKGKTSRRIKSDYFLDYEFNDIGCKLEQRDGTLRCYGPKRMSVGRFVKSYAPNNVIGLYSGEEDRLWTQFYEPYYKAYIRRINLYRDQDYMRLMFINKYYWNVALLTLLMSDNETLKPFIKNDLRIISDPRIELSFDFKYFDKVNEALKDFVDRINPDHLEKKGYSINDLKVVVAQEVEGASIIDDRRIFWNLTQACMHKYKKIITDITIRIDDELTVKQLSEGEKKLILVKTVLEILSDEKSLILMDEPDAHLHEIRKRELYLLMGQYRYRQIVITTHSPTFIDGADQSQVMMLKPSEDGISAVYEEEKVEAIRELTGSRFNAFLEKPILYCEGTETSVEYLLYPILFPDYKIIPAGGHEEVINFTKAYNKTFGSDAHYAIGIVDWDYTTEPRLSDLKQHKIYFLKVVEIENVLMDLVLLEAAKKEFCADEDSIDKVKEYLFDECKRHKEYQATKYTANTIVNQIKAGISPDGGRIENVKDRIKEVCDVAKLDVLYAQRLQCLDDILLEWRYDELVKIYDFNHNIDRFVRVMVDKYQSRILRLIHKRDDLREFVKTTYYPDIV